jgi:hydroxycarboxylate dehydrogenase B|tara:strand:- start:1787 stop:2854 length:1068 start_codon:yes stop_codon:yes gene_type:complete
MLNKDFYRVKAQNLRKALFLILKSYGVNTDRANLVSKYLVEADLSGQNSHGTARIPFYLKKVLNKDINIFSKTKIKKETATTAQVDGDWGFGQIAADKAIKICIKKAIKSNIACVTLKNANHMGRLADFTGQAAKKDLVGIGFANLHGTSHIVSPYGGIDRKLPTNPICISTPGHNKKNLFELDMSTSSVAEGKLKIDYILKRKTRRGYIIDNFGRDTQDTKKFYENPKGSLLPLGGISAFKGFGLAMGIDILSGALSEAGCSSSKYKKHGNSVTFIVIKISAFTKISKFKKNVYDLIKHVKKSKLQKGFKKILVPGEFETNNKIINIKKGVKIDKVTYKELKKIISHKDIKVKI